MPVIICPGIHSPELTDRFVQVIKTQVKQDFLVFPTEQYLPYSAVAVYQWLELQQLSKTEPLAFVAFSAGVVGGFGAALTWQITGGTIHSFIAFDGWGMPLIANFPLYRISHDYFTHWSSRILGAGQSDFYADPAVQHLEIWRTPENCQGWQAVGRGLKAQYFLTDYLANVLNS